MDTQRPGPHFMIFFRNAVQVFNVLMKTGMPVGDFKSHIFVMKKKMKENILFSFTKMPRILFPEDMITSGAYGPNGYDLLRFVVALYHYNDRLFVTQKVEEKVYYIFSELYYTFALDARVFV